MPNERSYQLEHFACFTGKSKSKSCSYPRDTRGFSLKIEALLKLLEKPDQGKGGDDDGDEIEERVGDDEVDDEDVRLSHPFQMHVATEVVDGERHYPALLVLAISGVQKKVLHKSEEKMHTK